MKRIERLSSSRQRNSSRQRIACSFQREEEEEGEEEGEEGEEGEEEGKEEERTREGRVEIQWQHSQAIFSLDLG